MLDAKILQTPAVIIDNGSESCKAGFTGESEPRSVLTSVVGHLDEEADDYYVGSPALFKKGALFLNYPIQRGIVTSWDDIEKLWRHIYQHELRVNPCDRPLLLSEPPLNPLRNRELTTELMFDHFRVPALYLSVQATLALYASARIMGLVLDSGHGVTHCVPVYDGSCLSHGVSRLNIAGRDVGEYLTSLLLKNSHRLARRPKRATVKYIKETQCYVALDPIEDMEKKAEEVLRLPDGNTFKIRFHLCQAPEILFAPNTIGIQALGLHSMIVRSIRKCDRDICGSLYGNLVLTGGSTLFPGLDARIFKEIEQHVPKGIPVRIIALSERTCNTWLGGSIITHLGSFAPMWVTREDYQELGTTVIHRKCF